MKKLIAVVVAVAAPSITLAADLSGDWRIESSVGPTPIVVNCTLIQAGDALTGQCTPVMENAETADLMGTVGNDSATWAYDVVFNGSPGHIEFQADSVADAAMSGTLMLSGAPTPFTATRQ